MYTNEQKERTVKQFEMLSHAQMAQGQQNLAMLTMHNRE